jgi:hypothetical protein
MRGRAGLAGALVLGAAAAATRVRAYDFFWHLAAGRWIAGHGEVPRSDPFSFTAAGVPWVDHGWLYQLGLHGVWSMGGLTAVWLARIALGAAIGGVIWAHVRARGVSAGAALLVCLGGLAGASARMTDRPEMVTLLFVAIAASWLCAGGMRPLALIPLAALWANIHAGSILAPLMASAALAGVLLDRARGRSDGPSPAILAIAAVGSGLALTVNPYGIQAVLVPLRLTRLVGESWVQNPEWTRTSPSLAPGLYLAIAGLAAAALLRRDRARGVPLALAAVGALLALQYVRNVGVFFILFPFAVAPFFADDRAGQRVGPVAGAAIALAGLAGFLLAPAAGSVGPGLQPDRYPVEAAAFVDREGLDGRIFNEVAFGGYLIWRFPDRPVFIDGRNEVYPELLADLFGAFRDPARFWSLSERWGIEVAMLRYPAQRQRVRYPGPPPRMVERSWSEVFFPSRDWALVHWDDTAMVRVRRATADPDWLARHELVLNPDDWEWARARILAGELDAGRVAAELRARAGRSRRAAALAAALEALLRRDPDA